MCAAQGLGQASTEALCFQPGTSWVSRDVGLRPGTEVASRDESDCLRPRAEPGLTVGAASSNIRPQVVARFSRRSEITPARIPPVTEKGRGAASGADVGHELFRGDQDTGASTTATVPEPIPTGHLKWPPGVWPRRIHLGWAMGVTRCLGSGFRATSKPLHLVGTNATATCLGHPCVISPQR